MSDRQFEDLLKETLEEYGEPGATPRDAMWQAVANSRRKIVQLPWWRRRVTRIDLIVGAAAAAVLILAGILVGRLSVNPVDRTGQRVQPLVAESPVPGTSTPDRESSTAAGGGSSPTGGGSSPTIESPDPSTGRSASFAGTSIPTGANGELDLGMRSPAGDGNREVLRLAATRYLSRTESFLTRWRAGDPAAASNEWTRDWARRGLTDVRLLLDTAGQDDPEMKSLLLDLEVILAQILQASAEGSMLDRDRAERRLNDRAVLPRLRNMIPAGNEAAATQGVPR